MSEGNPSEISASAPTVAPGKDDQATIIAQPVQSEKTQEPVNPKRPAGKWAIIVALLAIVAVIITGAIVALQVLEAQYYSQSPSAWPTSSQAR